MKKKRPEIKLSYFTSRLAQTDNSRAIMSKMFTPEERKERKFGFLIEQYLNLVPSCDKCRAEFYCLKCGFRDKAGTHDTTKCKENLMEFLRQKFELDEEEWIK